MHMRAFYFSLGGKKLLVDKINPQIMTAFGFISNLVQFIFQYCLQFNDDIIASGSSDSTVRLWSHQGMYQVLKSIFLVTYYDNRQTIKIQLNKISKVYFLSKTLQDCLGIEK